MNIMPAPHFKVRRKVTLKDWESCGMLENVIGKFYRLRINQLTVMSQYVDGGMDR